MGKPLRVLIVTPCDPPDHETLIQQYTPYWNPVLLESVSTQPELLSKLQSISWDLLLVLPTAPLSAATIQETAQMFAPQTPVVFLPAQPLSSTLMEIKQQATGQHSVETALQQSEERAHLLAQILENSSQPFAFGYVDGHIGIVNKAFTDLVGYSLEELQNLSWRDDLTPPEWHKIEEEALQKLLNYKMPIRYEKEYIRKDGIRVPIEILTQVITSSDGEIICYYGFVTDITARKTTETTLRQSEQTLKNQTIQLSLINRIGREITAQQNVEQILQTTVTLLQNAFDYERVGLFTHDPDFPGWVMRAKAGRNLPTVDFNSLPLSLQQLVKQVGESGQCWITGNNAGFPLLQGKTNVGVLLIQYNPSQPPDEHQFRTLGILTDQIAVALKNASLYEETQRRLAREEQLNTLAHILGSEMELASLIPRLLAGATELTNSDGAALGVLNPQTQTVRYRYLYHLPDLSQIEIPLSTGLAGQAIRTGQPAWTNAYAQYPEALPDWTEIGLRSSLVVPIATDTETIGVLAVCSMGKKLTFTPEIIATTEAVARLAAVAVQRARLFEAEHEQRRLAEALAEAAAAINSTLELDEVLDRILEQALRVVPGESCNIMLIQEGMACFARGRGYDRFGVDQWIEDLTFSIAETANFRKIIETRLPYCIPNITEDRAWISFPSMTWVRSCVSAPICIDNEVVGFLNVDGTQPGQFNEPHAHRLQAFADQAAIALENARLYQKSKDYTAQLEQRVRERTAQLNEQAARAAAILRSASDGLMVTDQEGWVLQVNPTVVNWTNRMTGNELAQWNAALKELAQHAAEHPEMTFELPGLDLQLSAAPVEGYPSTVVVAAHNITQFKALDRLKSQFISNVSHELRTPITAINLYLTLMERTTPDRWPPYVEALKKEAARQSSVLEEVLEISRLDAGHTRLRIQHIDVSTLLQKTLENYRPLAELKEITLSLAPMEPGLQVLIDPEKFAPVLNNLMENALHYTTNGGSVEVKAELTTTIEPPQVIITIEDTGIGIPEIEIPYIFDRFYRGLEPQQTQIPGSGLGLSIVKEIIELHGGSITVASQKGRGTKFWIYLLTARSTIK